MTTRGFVEKDFSQVVNFVDRVIKLGNKIKVSSKEDLVRWINENKNKNAELTSLNREVTQFTNSFEEIN